VINFHQNCGNVLRAVLGPTRKEVTGNWRKYLIEELHDFTPHQALFWR